jgi:hypothetical protein
MTLVSRKQRPPRDGSDAQAAAAAAIWLRALELDGVGVALIARGRVLSWWMSSSKLRTRVTSRSPAASARISGGV